MKVLNGLLILSAVILLVGCTKKESNYKQYDLNGVRITENSTTPADSTFRIELKEVGFINMENETDTVKFLQQISDFEFDGEGNLFILDGKKHRIHKYDKNFNFVKAFGRNGKGPGEFWLPGKMNIRKDTLFLANWSNLKIIKFDLEGNYIGDITQTDHYKFPAYPKKFGNKYISKSTRNKLNEEQQMVLVDNTSLYDSKFNHIKNIFNIEYAYNGEEEGDPGAKGVEVCFNDSLLFASVNSKDKYQIDVYDNEGNKIREIRKNYRRTNAGPEMQKYFDEMNEKYGSKYKVLYVNSIMNMLADKYGRLWVNVYDDSDLEGHLFDVYKNDIYQNRIKLDLPEGYTRLTVGERIIAVNPDNNNIKIYEY